MIAVIPPPTLVRLSVNQKISHYTAEKIKNLVPHILISFLTGNFFSSKQFYQCVQATLITVSFLGVLGATGLLVTGLPGVSILTIVLSSTTAVGAYMAHQASQQQSFVENNVKMEQQNEIFARQNERLQRTVYTFSQHTLQFNDQQERRSLEFDDQMKRLSLVTDKLSSIPIFGYEPQKTLSSCKN